MPSIQNLVAIARACGVLADIPTADAERLDAHEERELRSVYRDLPRRSQHVLMQLAQALQSGKRRSGRGWRPLAALAGSIRIHRLELRRMPE